MNKSELIEHIAKNADITKAQATRALEATLGMIKITLRKGGGGKLSRSETVTVRLDPKLRYLAELAARLHRRTLSSYVEWAIEASLDNNVLKPDFDGRGTSIKDDAEYLWDVVRRWRVEGE